MLKLTYNPYFLIRKSFLNSMHSSQIRRMICLQNQMKKNISNNIYSVLSQTSFILFWDKSNSFGKCIIELIVDGFVIS